MKYKILKSLLLTVLLCNSSSAMDEKEANTPTKNGFGITYGYLGEFEDDFLAHLDKLDKAEGVPQIISLGDGLGRLGKRALESTTKAVVFVNDVSKDNLLGLQETLVALYKGSDQEKARGKRLNLIVGDCLTLENNTKLTSILQKLNPKSPSLNSYFDQILCSNVSHFLNGQQILKLFINSFNHLKPGGRFYFFGTSYCPDMQNQGNKLSVNYVKTKLRHEFMKAGQSKGVFFPCLFHDKWIVQKTPMFEKMFGLQNNQITYSNIIPAETVRKIAINIGFNVVILETYSPCEGGYWEKCKEGSDDFITYFGAILEKPVSYEGGILLEANLEDKFVKDCLASEEEMRNIIDKDLEFKDKYPFVTPKKKTKSQKSKK